MIEIMIVIVAVAFPRSYSVTHIASYRDSRKWRRGQGKRRMQNEIDGENPANNNNNGAQLPEKKKKTME